MTLTNPAYLIGLSALGVPIALHLINRSVHRPMRLGTARLLGAVVGEQSRYRRPRRWLLLAMRMAFVILAVLLFCKPVSLSTAGDADRGGYRLIVVDRSPSMSARVGDGRRRIDVAVRRAQGLLRRWRRWADDGAAVEVGWADRDLRLIDPDRFRAIESPEVAVGPLELGPVMTSVVERLTEHPLASEVCLITDRQANIVDAATPVNWPEGVRWVVETVGGEPVENVGVGKVAVRSELSDRSEEELSNRDDRGVTGGGILEGRRLPRRTPPSTAVRVSAELSRSDDFVASDATVRFDWHRVSGDAGRDVVGGSIGPAVRTVSAAVEWGGSDAAVSVAMDTPPPGRYRVRSTLVGANDALSWDDSGETAVVVAGPVPVTILAGGDGDPSGDEGGEAAGFVAAALSADVDRGRPRFRTRVWSVRDAGRVASLDPADDVLVWIDPPADPGPNAREVERWVRRGGRVLWFLGDRVVAAAGEDAPVRLPVTGMPTVRGRRASGLSPYRMHPVGGDGGLDVFDDFQVGHLSRLRFDRVVALDESETSGGGVSAPVTTLANFEPGLPAVTRVGLGGGSMVVCGFEPTRRDGPFVTHRLFAPLVQQLVAALAGIDGDGPVVRRVAASREELGVRVDGRRLVVGRVEPSEFDLSTVSIERMADAVGVPMRDIVDGVSEPAGTDQRTKTDRPEGSDTDSKRAVRTVAAGRTEAAIEAAPRPPWRWAALGLIALVILEPVVAARTPA